jgi:hypothetical protein
MKAIIKKTSQKEQAQLRTKPVQTKPHYQTQAISLKTPLLLKTDQRKLSKTSLLLREIMK